jgi:starvation-inducible outer membrane lipoprotein
MKKLLMLILLAFLLAACSETTKYVKPGSTQADFEAAKVDCHNQIMTTRTGAAVARAQMSTPGVRPQATQTASAMARKDVDECLRAKGWMPQTKN